MLQTVTSCRFSSSYPSPTIFPKTTRRQDVSHLSVRDLMLLDTKVVTLRGLRVAVCSIFGTAREVISMAGSPMEVAKIAKVLAKDRGVMVMMG